MPITDLGGRNVRISFYITREQGFMLLRNEIMHLSYHIGPKNVLKIPAGVCGIHNQDVVLQEYFERTIPDHTEAGRTHLLVVPSKRRSFKSFLSGSTSPSPQTGALFPPAVETHDSAARKRFSRKLHGYNHFSIPDMRKVCGRVGIPTDQLHAELVAALRTALTAENPEDRVDPARYIPIAYFRRLTTWYK